MKHYVRNGDEVGIARWMMGLFVVSKCDFCDTEGPCLNLVIVDRHDGENWWICRDCLRYIANDLAEWERNVYAMTADR